ncbi:hypothetical protein NBZ79_16400 [Sneathiella marina]|uniref:SHOCT domain-containing protein n=1 Tax=Sneathiella marina TaxID=2950108 RepID=A0ABY4W3P3_9PROT|nr:hypothetical protein [Sneathiella marina]USG60743.1 hypothetical protein NBZ79_16400 [Sneathiella marina]
MSKFWIILSTVAFLSACGSNEPATVTDKTVGQELIDLKKAFDTGTISKDEYEDLREAILDKNS